MQGFAKKWRSFKKKRIVFLVNRQFDDFSFILDSFQTDSSGFEEDADNEESSRTIPSHVSKSGNSKLRFYGDKQTTNYAALLASESLIIAFYWFSVKPVVLVSVACGHEPKDMGNDEQGQAGSSNIIKG